LLDPFTAVRRPTGGARHRRLLVYLSDEEAHRLLSVVRSDEGLTPRQRALHR
jgi:hypothetical protein